jgi:tRNA(Arg) A34 adenosine deaminase TadA
MVYPVQRLLSAEEAGQVAFDLGGDVAFLLAEQGLLYAHASGSGPAAYRLLRAIHAAEAAAAKWIVRRTLFTTEEATATVRGTVRLAGRRLVRVRPLDHGLSVPGPARDMGRELPTPRRALPSIADALQAVVDAFGPGDDPLELARALVREMTGHDARGAAGRRDRPIAALLVDHRGNLLEWATSGGADNVTSHAEVNLLELWGRPLPPGARVVTTLKPCRMCAGLVWDRAEDRSQPLVVYGEDDPGRAARATVLDAGSDERRRFAQDAGEATRVLQEPYRTRVGLSSSTP